MRLASAITWLSKRLRLSSEGVLWLLLCVALMATGLFKSINLITLLACVLLSAIACNYVLSRRQVVGLKVVRDIPELANVGDTIRWRVLVQPLDGRFRFGVRVRDPGCEEDQSRSLRGFAERVPVTGFTLDSMFQPTVRGIHELPPITIASGYPLGLAAVSRIFPAAGRLIVGPRLGVVHRSRLRHWFSRTCVRGGTVRTFTRRTPGAQTEFHGLRLFRAGDNPRAIHWPTSARKNTLMVREFEEYPNDDLVLIVDLTVSHADQPHRARAFERMLSVAASICREWCRQKGDRLTLVLAGEKPEFLHGTTGQGFLSQAYQLLAAAKSEPRHDSSLSALRDHPLPLTAHLLLSVGPSRLPEAIHDVLHQPMANVDVMAADEAAFFEMSV